MSPHAAPPAIFTTPFWNPFGLPLKLLSLLGRPSKLSIEQPHRRQRAGLIDVSLGDFARSVSHFRAAAENALPTVKCHIFVTGIY